MGAVAFVLWIKLGPGGLRQGLKTESTDASTDLLRRLLEDGQAFLQSVQPTVRVLAGRRNCRARENTSIVTALQWG